MTQEEFITKARAIYGDKYDYSKVVYRGVNNKVIIINKCTGEERLVKPKKLLYRDKYKRIPREERTNAFIRKSKEKFGDKFDYSKVEYIDSQTPVTLICKEHGEFSVNMYRHLYSKDGLCPLCNSSMNKYDRDSETELPASCVTKRGSGVRLSTDYLIKKCQYFYGEKYDYSKVEYKGGSSRKEVIEIVCPKHGSFFKCVDNINKRDCGCPMCSKERRELNNITSNANRFIEKSKEKFGDRFDYSEVKYVNSQTPIILICKGHGVRFNIVPNVHLNSKFGGCKECYKDYIESTRSKNIRVKLTEEERKERRIESNKKRFIERSIRKFGDRFDYSRVEYIDSNTPVNIIDKEMNNEIFSIKPYNFLHSVNGRSNPNKVRVTKEEFIERARKFHGDKYDYSKVVYKGDKVKVCIICPIHGEFWQLPHNHLNVVRGGCGCPKCSNTVSKLEESVINRLKEENIRFEAQYTDSEIFGKMRGDFFIKSYNVMIECQGKQHFEECNSFHSSYGGSLSGQIERDCNFNKCCRDANIKLLYYFSKDNASGVDYLNDKKFNGIYTEKNTFTDMDNLMLCIKTVGTNNL